MHIRIGSFQISTKDKNLERQLKENGSDVQSVLLQLSRRYGRYYADDSEHSKDVQFFDSFPRHRNVTLPLLANHEDTFVVGPYSELPNFCVNIQGMKPSDYFSGVSQYYFSQFGVFSQELDHARWTRGRYFRQYPRRFILARDLDRYQGKDNTHPLLPAVHRVVLDDIVANAKPIEFDKEGAKKLTIVIPSNDEITKFVVGYLNSAFQSKQK